jgi:hypothetical protein
MVEVTKGRPVDRHRLIVAGADHLAVADVVDPRCAVERDVLLAGER